MKKLAIVVLVLAMLGAGAYGVYWFKAGQEAAAWEAAHIALIDDMIENGCDNYDTLLQARTDSRTLPWVWRRVSDEAKDLMSLVSNAGSPCSGIRESELRLAATSIGWDDFMFPEDRYDDFGPRYTAEDVAKMVAETRASGQEVLHARLDEKGIENLWELCDWRFLPSVGRTEYPRYAELVAWCAERDMKVIGGIKRSPRYLAELKRLVEDAPRSIAAKKLPELEAKLAAEKRKKARRLEEEAAKLPPLNIVGKSDGPPTITILNASARGLSLTLGSKRYRITPAKLQPGATYDRYQPCANKTPTFAETVPPGTYEAKVVVSGDSKVTPFRGVWKVHKGNAYALCLYIDSRPR